MIMVLKMDVLKMKIINPELDKKVALTNLSNFISSEVYRCAVLELFNDEFNRLQGLKKEIFFEIDSINLDFFLIGKEEIVNEIIDNIVLEKTADDLDGLFNDYFEFDLGDIDDLNKLIEVSHGLCDKYKNWDSEINHIYTPSVLTREVCYDFILSYIEGKLFYSDEYVDDEGNKGFSVFRFPLDNNPSRYKDGWYSFRRSYSDPVGLPCNTLYRKFINPGLSEEALYIDRDVSLEKKSALFCLEYLDGEKDSVSFIKKMAVIIDLDKVVDEPDVEELLADLKVQIHSVNYENIISRNLVAESFHDILPLSKGPKIEDSVELSYRKRAIVDGVDTLADSKNAILGLKAWYLRKIKFKDDEEGSFPCVYGNFLSKDDAIEGVCSGSNDEGGKRGRGDTSVRKGYDAIVKAIKKDIAFLRRGRLQVRRPGTTRREVLLKSPDVNFEDIHPKDKILAKKKMDSLFSRGKKPKIKRHPDGSIWVVSNSG